MTPDQRRYVPFKGYKGYMVTDQFRIDRNDRFVIVATFLTEEAAERSAETRNRLWRDQITRRGV